MNKDLRETLELNKDKLITIGIILLIFIAIGFVYKVDNNRNKSNQTVSANNSSITKQNDSKKNETLTPRQEKLVALINSGKSYAEFTEEEKSIYKDLVDNWDILPQNFRNKYQSLKDTFEKKQNDYLNNQTKEQAAKQSEQNKQTYADLIKEIETSYPDMKVSGIDGENDKKFLNIHMNLLHNLTATEEKACELTVMKETRMKEAGISSITIFVQDRNGKQQGLLMFDLENGEYKPVLNTLK